jgi:L-lactate dehydrogenase complex protein LldG
MTTNLLIEKFTVAARNVGAEVVAFDSVALAADFIAKKIEGSLLVPAFSSGSRFKLKAALKKAGVTIESDNFRAIAAQAEAGITGVNFAIADTGTLVLESTAADIRLETTLPP